MSNTSTEDLIAVVTTHKQEPTQDELDSFKNLVTDWFKFDDQIRKLEVALKERKNYQRALNNKIQDFMIKYEYSDLNTQHGRIKSNIREVKQPITIKNIKEQIMNNKDISGDKLIDIIFNGERETVVKKNIKRFIPKVSLNLL